MILVCPSCGASYLLSASVFAGGARQVRCARCGKAWLADLPSKMTVMPKAENPVKNTAAKITKKPDAVEEHIVTKPIPIGSNLPAIVHKRSWRSPYVLKHAVAYAIVALVILLGVAGRQVMAEKWPMVGWFYNVIGFETHYEGEGLGLKNVRSERRYENGGMQLFVEGEIHNDSEKIQKIPDIEVTAIGTDGKMTQKWKIDRPADTMLPHEFVPFKSLLGTNQGAVVEVNLSFVGSQHESEK